MKWKSMQMHSGQHHGNNYNDNEDEWRWWRECSEKDTLIEVMNILVLLMGTGFKCFRDQIVAGEIHGTVSDLMTVHFKDLRT